VAGARVVRQGLTENGRPRPDVIVAEQPPGESSRPVGTPKKIRVRA